MLNIFHRIIVKAKKELCTNTALQEFIQQLPTTPLLRHPHYAIPDCAIDGR